MNVELETGDLIGRGRKTVNLPNHLDLIATAPDGIQKLRGLVLELAVRGKLVPQVPHDEPANELLKRITQERVLLEADKPRKKHVQKPLGAEDKLFELPASWRWVRFGEVALHNSGKTLDKGRNAGESRDYITTSNLYWGRFELGELRQMLIGADELERCTARKHDLLICEGGEAGRAAVWPHENEVCFQNHVHRARFLGGIDPYFGFRFFEWLNASGEIGEYRKGVGISNMSGKALASIPFTLPPLAEQHRIITKVDELMALCDRLEAEQADAESAHARLVETLLVTLTQSTGAADLATNWHRLAEHFDTLFTTESSLDALKQAILQLAVMGKLVPQDPLDEPASELLKRIAKERARLEAEGLYKKSRPVPPVSEDEQPFAIPAAWKWTTLQAISSVGTGTTPSRTNPAYFAPLLIPWVTSGETRDPFIGATAQKVSPLALKETNLTVYPVGTLIVAMYGQGKTRGQISELQIEATTNQACAAIVPTLADRPLRKYIKLFFEKIYDEIREEAAGGAQPNLNVGKIKATHVSLPPLAEQHRIVAKVDELMALSDRLKADLADARSRQARLATTLIDTALQAA